MIIIMRFGENNVLCPKYIDIYEFWGVWGDILGPPYVFLYYSKKRKKYNSKKIMHFISVLFTNIFNITDE